MIHAPNEEGAPSAPGCRHSFRAADWKNCATTPEVVEAGGLGVRQRFWGEAGFGERQVCHHCCAHHPPDGAEVGKRGPPPPTFPLTGQGRGEGGTTAHHPPDGAGVGERGPPRP